MRPHIVHHAHLEPAHGTSTAEELAGHGYEISPGTPYPVLHHARGRSLTSRRQVVDGRARRVYEITDPGRAALAEERAELAELAVEIRGVREQQ